MPKRVKAIRPLAGAASGAIVGVRPYPSIRPLRVGIIEGWHGESRLKLMLWGRYTGVFADFSAGGANDRNSQ
jgi:hypothetical protein